ncbi:amidohydrolase [Candidatus Bathyarchaeota archaeon]|nr:amidohydrolase [Candidatus Bathyarchaeota archaeon]MBT4320095.1 amidohydrolase [Candidatus Bathyarchaeota archaeon]MBT4424025.1 amidohydrolase [Candidatus Bathyarchaeota archaeon]MBT5642771.1 amidohydrolase [Candidatus Bathyarchaeota archaeon]MBT6603525.1 amidohydrolase [Candidatus Bathyarchaeota archaeon]
MKDTAYQWIDENEKKIIGWSDKVWDFAELGLLEFKTAEYLSNISEKSGFKVDRGVAEMPSAFMGSWTNGEGGPTIGILGELDALAGISQKAVPYKDPVKEGAPGHGCGHNIYGAGAVAAGIALKVAMEEHNIPGTIKVYGCPAEETLVGKVWMVRDGLFDGVDAVLAHHPSSSNTAGTGSSNAMNSFKVHFYGRTAHSAGDPENGISALDAVELMSNGVNFMREHVTEKTRVHYIHEEAGGQPNVVPAYARTWYYNRAPERAQVNETYDWIMDIVKGANLMARTTSKVEFLTGCYDKMPNGVLARLVVEKMRDIGAPKFSDEDYAFAKKMSENWDVEKKMNSLQKSGRPDWQKLRDVDFDDIVRDDYRAGMVGAGSTDVSDVSWVTPTIEFSTTCMSLGTPGHSWQFTAQTGHSIGHKGLMFSTKVHAAAGLELLTKPELMKKVKAEWVERLNGRVYESPIPKDLKPPLDQLKDA